jgi:hypothetical protein
MECFSWEKRKIVQEKEFEPLDVLGKKRVPRKLNVFIRR